MRLRHPPVGRRFSLVLLTSALAVTGVLAAPQIIRHQPRPIGIIRGHVFNAAGFAVFDARVMLQDADGRNPRTTVTNSQGRFIFSKLPIGLYHVRAAWKDRSSEWRQNVVVLTGKQTDVTLHLSDKEAPQAPNPASFK